jgi:hypothetical protein
MAFRGLGKKYIVISLKGYVRVQQMWFVCGLALFSSGMYTKHIWLLHVFKD